MSPYKVQKITAGLSEIAFLRFFLPFAVAIPFLQEFGMFFFLALTAVDTWRCVLFFQDPKAKEEPLTKAFYGLKALFNIIASFLIIWTLVFATPLLGMETDTLELIGQIMFIAGVVAPTAFRYLLKALRPIPSHQLGSDNKITEHQKAIKNLMLAFLLFGVTIGMGFLFFTDLTLHEAPLGLVILAVSHTLPILFYGAILPLYYHIFPEPPQRPNKYEASPWLTFSALLLVAGFATWIFAPESTLQLQENPMLNLGLGIMLVGFVIGTGVEIKAALKRIEPEDSAITPTTYTDVPKTPNTTPVAGLPPLQKPILSFRSKPPLDNSSKQDTTRENANCCAIQ